MKKFNINNEIKIKLTDYGREIHKRNYINFWKPSGLLDKHPYSPPEEDEDGYCTVLFWEMIKEFGSYMKMEGKLPFETIILISEDDLK